MIKDRYKQQAIQELDSRPIDPRGHDSYQDALDRIRESARALDGLGKVAASSLDGVLEEITEDELSDREYESSAKQQEARDAKISEAAFDMIDLLPQAALHTRMATLYSRTIGNGSSWLRAPGYELTERYMGIEDGVSYKRYEFRDSDISKLRRLTPFIWWVSDMGEEDVQHAELENKKKMDKVGIRYSVRDTTVPYFAIGERQIEAKKDRSDATVEILLVPAVEDGRNLGAITARVSSRLRDLRDDATKAQLHVPYTQKDVEQHTVDDEYYMHDSLKKLHESKKYGAVKQPFRAKKQEKFWEKHAEDASKGRSLPAEIDQRVEIDEETYSSFNVPFYAQSLAILLNNEQAYLDTLGKLPK